MYDLDAVLAELKFGKFQIKLFLLIGFPILINAILSSGYIFTAAQIAYRCALKTFPYQSETIIISFQLPHSRL